jgi:hypothetical protein
MKKENKIISCFPLFFFLFSFSSCQTAPETTDFVFEETQFIPLDSGASVYVLADMRDARPVIDLLPVRELKDKQVRQMIDKTNYITAALFPPKDERNFQLAARGNYPASRVSLAFSLNKQWKKQRSPEGTFWHSAANGLSVKLNLKQAFVVSKAGSPVYPAAASSGVKIPQELTEFMRNFEKSALFCWLEDPAPFINQMLNNNGFPVRVPAEKLFISLLPAGENKYEAAIRLQFENASQARGLAAILALAGNLIPASSIDPMSAALFFANPPAQNGSNIDIKTAPLSEQEISLLFQIFLIN